MLLFQLLVLALAAALSSAAIFPPGSLVKSLDAKGFKKAMKESRTSVVAFVAPWCGHCQKLAPEYSKAAKSLNPLVPLYAVDCDADENKSLCVEQKIEGFPTIKVFPRGSKKPPVLYDGERNAGALVEFTSKRIPYKVEKLSELDDILTWVKEEVDTPRALLLTKDKKIPMLWKVLSNKYSDLKFGSHRDSVGMTAAMLGLDTTDAKSKILIYTTGSKKPERYEGSLKYNSLSKFFDSVLDGTAEFKKEGKSKEPELAKTDAGQTKETPIVVADDTQATFAEFVNDAHNSSQHEAHSSDFEHRAKKETTPEADMTFSKDTTATKSAKSSGEARNVSSEASNILPTVPPVASSVQPISESTGVASEKVADTPLTTPHSLSETDSGTSITSKVATADVVPSDTVHQENPEHFQPSSQDKVTPEKGTTPSGAPPGDDGHSGTTVASTAVETPSTAPGEDHRPVDEL